MPALSPSAPVTPSARKAVFAPAARWTGSAIVSRTGTITIRVATLAIAIGAAYYLAVRLGLGFRFQNSQIGVVWPANALLLSALLVVPRRSWWVVLTAAVVAHGLVMQGVVPAWRWSWQILVNGCFVIGTATLLKRYTGPLRFGTQRQVVLFLLIIFGTSLSFGFTTPSFVRSLFGLEVVTPLGAALRTMMSNATAMLMVTPMAVLWIEGRRRSHGVIPVSRFVEAFGIMVSLCVACLLGLASGPGIARNPSLLLLVFPPLLWAAVRFGPIGAVTSLFFISATSIWASEQQLGPFVLMNDAHAVLSLQMFWLVLSVPVLLLASVIREREQAEEELHDQRNQLAHVTRVATVGTLSGALAHELGQPLSSILVNAQAALRMLDKRSPDIAGLRGALEDIALQDRQATQVIKHLRAMLKHRDGHYENVMVDTVVRDALSLARSPIRWARVQVNLRIASDLPPVWGDAVQLLQVVLNLIINSCEAMAEREVNERHLWLHVRHEGSEVEIAVTDTGTGLPTLEEGSVFEPFYTTKKKGLGLGLAISRSIVAAHGGQLWAENNPHRGATFRISLPAARQSSLSQSLRRS